MVDARCGCDVRSGIIQVVIILRKIKLLVCVCNDIEKGHTRTGQAKVGIAMSNGWSPIERRWLPHGRGGREIMDEA